MTIFCPVLCHCSPTSLLSPTSPHTLSHSSHPNNNTALVSASCKALCHLSYVWPGAVLPLVLSRFQAALQTATAMHQVSLCGCGWLGVFEKECFIESERLASSAAHTSPPQTHLTASHTFKHSCPLTLLTAAHLHHQPCAVCAPPAAGGLAHTGGDNRTGVCVCVRGFVCVWVVGWLVGGWMGGWGVWVRGRWAIERQPQR